MDRYGQSVLTNGKRPESLHARETGISSEVVGHLARRLLWCIDMNVSVIFMACTVFVCVNSVAFNNLGCVHTWCPSISARAPAQSGAVFRHWVPDM